MSTDLDPKSDLHEAQRSGMQGVSESQSAGDVGIRSRGRGSRSPDKPNLDVNIGKYVRKQRFAGLEDRHHGRQQDHAPFKAGGEELDLAVAVGVLGVGGAVGQR